MCSNYICYHFLIIFFSHKIEVSVSFFFCLRWNSDQHVPVIFPSIHNCYQLCCTHTCTWKQSRWYHSPGPCFLTAAEQTLHRSPLMIYWQLWDSWGYPSLSFTPPYVARCVQALLKPVCRWMTVFRNIRSAMENLQILLTPLSNPPLHLSPHLTSL